MATQGMSKIFTEIGEVDNPWQTRHLEIIWARKVSDDRDYPCVDLDRTCLLHLTLVYLTTQLLTLVCLTTCFCCLLPPPYL